jgi:EAL domain-containing protein (putative c-di-GMP-specific phosphodiesterase class I)
VSPAHGRRLPELLQRADVAMYAAKRARSGQSVYAVGADHNSRRRLALASELRDAFTRGELVPAYQPLCDPATREVLGVEALVRWRHPLRGVLLPGDFLPVAEETGLIRELTPYLLPRVLRDARDWMDAGSPLRVSVNLTAHDLLDPALPAMVEAELTACGVPADLLCLEVTEQHLLADRETVLESLHRLRDLGVMLAIDDYGTGYCGLAYLRDLPVDYVKIDRSFVQTMTTDRANEIIVRSSLELAHRLGLRVVAEGVEHEDALPQLVQLGCELAQGFLLGEPMPPVQISALLAATGSVPGQAPRPSMPSTRSEVRRDLTTFGLDRT